MSEKLSNKIVFAYGFGEFALGFLTTMGVQYISFFLTDAALIAPAVVATILLIGRIADTVDVPIIGIIVEKSNLPWGKYRSWLFLAAPLIVIFNMLMFTNFNVSTPVKIFYLSAAYILGYVFVNFCSTGRFALLPTFTSDQNERAKLASARGQGGSLGQIVRGLITVPLIGLLGGGNDAKGYFYTVTVYGIIVIIGMYWLASLAKDYDKPGAQKASSQRVTLKDMLTQVATNKPLLILMISNTVILTATNILTGFNMYYFRYVVGSLLMMSIYFPISFGGGFLGNAAAQFLAKRFDKKATYNIGIGFWFLGMLLVYLLAGSNAYLFIAFVTVAQFGFGISNAVVPAFFSDTADYGEWKTGKSSRAVNMGLVIFPIKLGVLIGGSIAAFALAYIGFVANTQDPVIINGIRTMAAVLPMVVSILAAVIMYFYPLNREKMESIQQELKNRKGVA
ncbi:putative symporter YjmB [Oxobacter pfennigii]|uniref:Putative symporter YjmB n=1 Tax=Oxobacter pfennigii TaxID=36849 RepID=A0A0P8W6R3_9CLOT|nr:glycoside-pentoside-hexuronide (GPH):cation symporter [Oxobacter pfennigii]KPU43733.1 putative symporter YjmB [Oxobacter pfennigii]